MSDPPAFRPIGEVAAIVGVAPHVLRFWEEKFPEIAPVKRAGGRRYYRADDVRLLTALHGLLHGEGMTIRGVRQRIDARGVAALVPEPAADWRAAVDAIRADLAAALDRYRGITPPV